MDKNLLQLSIGVFTVIATVCAQLYISRKTINHNRKMEMREKALEVIERLNLSKGSIHKIFVDASFYSWIKPNIMDDDDIEATLDKMRPKLDYDNISKAKAIIYMHFPFLINDFDEISDLQTKLCEFMIHDMFDHVSLFENDKRNISEDEIASLKDQLADKVNEVSHLLRNEVGT